MTTSWRGWLRGLVALRPTRFDWVDAVRAGTCAGGVVLIGWVLGELSAGLTASVGAFTALYGQGRPYRSRAVELAVIAVAFAGVVTLGALSAVSVWLAVVVVAALAVVATWLCQALDTGPPGAYMFVLAAATASNIPGAATEPWRLGLLVLAGGALAWLLHMSGVLAGVRRPEKAALRDGTAAVARLVEGVHEADYAARRDRAARAMHRCWVVLVGRQPAAARRDGTLERLRAIGLEVHGLLADAVRAHDEGRPVDPSAAARLRAVPAAIADPPSAPGPLGPADVPRGGPGPVRAAREVLATGSPWRVVLLRVALGALVAGALGASVGLDHAYWAVAATVLVLCQGLSWAGTLERAVQRLLGTWLGLLLAAVVLAAEPAGVGLAVTVAVLQGAVQLAMPRNYGLGVVVITPLALTIGSGGHPADLGGFLLARGVDTAVGCALGVVVFLLVRPGPAQPAPAALVAGTLRDAARVVPHLADRTTATPAAREARRDLNRDALALADAHQVAELALPGGRGVQATVWWPALDTARRLAHEVLAACWAVDGGEAATPVTAARAGAVAVELDALSRRTTSGDGAVPDAGDGFLARDLDAVRRSLPRDA
ncbi:FUSC family protein [Actinomycetospora sp. TBRC 11914]|uniref:FUSC family protein n=1 Tax=Actinomycetospora sp. TBRC 11914 TaxID=2729387 RepID=UPI00145E89C4|nr:FUSC family protein [Actinomycetospora sp. TBRC 11914]NMO90702.1 FUSC family protein [Actinomycetospora sp. TBRC 11914]